MTTPRSARPRTRPRTPRVPDPWRAVLLDPEPWVAEGRGGVLGPDTDRRTRWWEMTLECGHRVERTVRYRPRTAEQMRWNRTRSADDVLPHPKRVRCEECGMAARQAAR